MRNVYCTCRGGSVRGTEEDCLRDDLRPKPIERRSCGEECANFSWAQEQWGACSVDCGSGGQETREVYCQKMTMTSMTRVGDGDCLDSSVVDQVGEKPATRRACDPTPQCRYRVGTWSDCTVTCGGGRRARTVGCDRINSDGSPTPVPLQACMTDSSIPGVRPASTDVCGTQFCRE